MRSASLARAALPISTRPCRFTCVDRETQSLARRPRVYIAKQLRRGAPLVAAQADADDAVADVAKRDGFIEHSLSGFGAEVPHCIEDPIQRHSEIVFPTFSPTFQAFEQRRELSAPPVNDPDRDVRLRVQHILHMQFLHHAVGNEFVVLGRPQPLRDRLKCQQKSREIFVLVKSLGLFFSEHAPAVGNVGVAVIVRSERSRVAAAQLRERCRIDRALKMQVQLGLGQRADEPAGCVGTECLPSPVFRAELAAIAAVKQVHGARSPAKRRSGSR